MDPDIPCIDGAAYRRHLIRRGLLVPVSERRTISWWHPSPPTCLLLGVPEEQRRFEVH